MKRNICKGIIFFAIMMIFVSSKQTVTASAYTVFNNDHLRFGNGVEDSINASGNLKQPFYWNGEGWRALTFSNYALDFEIREGGSGEEWNLSGSGVYNPTLTGLPADTSEFTSYEGGANGYGTIIKTGTVVINGKDLQIKNTYMLLEGKSYMKITSEFKNLSTSPMTNLRYWVGTRDDYVGQTDGPRKEKGNLADGSFSKITSQNDRARALRISTSDEGILFYTDTNKANLIIGDHYHWQYIINRNPVDSPISLTGDDSYAFYVKLNDLAAGESDQIVWYYAAGPIDELESIVQDVSMAVGAVTNIVGDEVDFKSTSSVDGTGYYIVVPAGSTAPDIAQIEAGTNYGDATVATSDSSSMTANQEIIMDISGLSANTAYDLYFVVKDSEGNYSSISKNQFTTVKYENSISFDQPDSKIYGDDIFSLNVTSDSGLPISYESSDTRVATVDASGNLTIIGQGTTNITASDGGNESYEAAEDVVRTLTVAKKDASVIANDKSKIYGEVDPTLDGTITGFLAADNVTPAYSRIAGETVETYTISAVLSPTQVLDNYNITYTTDDLTIAKRQITVEAAADNKTYDGSVSSDKIPSIISGTLADGQSAIWSQEYDNKDVGTNKVMIPTGMVKDSSNNDTTSNYEIDFSSVAGVITIADPLITLNDKTTSYTGDAISIEPAVILGVPGEIPTGAVSYVYYTDRSCTTLTTLASSGSSANGQAPAYAGIYYVKATIGETLNYTSQTTSAPGTLTITSTNVVLPFSIGSDFTKIYGDESFRLNSSGGSGLGEITFTSKNPSVVSISTDGYVTINSVGSAEITATKATDGNYDAQTATTTITVTEKLVTYTIANNSKVYTGAAQYASVTPSVSTLVADSDYTVKYYKKTDNTIVISPIEKGDYKIIVTTTNDNYKGSKEGTLTISNADQVSALEIGGLPGYIEHQDSFTLYANGGNGDGLITWKSSDTNVATIDANGNVEIVKVGSATITVTKAADKNYKEETSTVTITASKKDISYEITDNDYTYDNTCKSVTVTPSISGFTAYTVTGNEKTEAGEYDIRVTTNDTNYIGSATAKLVINKADLEVGISQDDGVYGEVIENPLVTGAENYTSVKITYEGYRIVDEIENKPTNAGDYTVIARFEGDANHKDAEVKYNFTIAKKKLTVTTDNQSRKYMEENPVLTVTYNGFVTGDSASNLYIEPQVTTTATKDSDVGPYDIRVSGGVTSNYEFVYVNTGKLTIVKTSQNIPLYITNAPNTTTFGDEFILYANGGSSSNSLEWQSSNISVATIDNDGNVKIVGVGEVTFTALKDADTNFEAQSESVTIEAVKKPITYEITNIYQRYDGEVKSVTVTPSVLGFTEYTVTGDKQTEAGSYEITVTTNNPKYQGSETAELVINKADSSASVVQGDITYGTELDPTLEFTDGSCQVTYMGTSIPWETVNKPSKPGTYTVIARVTGDANHNDSIATNAFVIDKKMLTVTAVDTTKNYNEENPSFALTYEGFVYGDDESNLYIKPIGTTDASKTSEAGEYDIVPIGGMDTNYDFTYVKARLEILGIGQTTSLYITNAPSDASASYKDEFTLYANGGDGTGSISWSSSNTDIATIDSAGLVEIVGIGNVTFTVTKASDANFAEQTESATIRAYPKAIRVTAIATDRPYEVGNKDIEVRLIAEIDDVTASAISATVSTDSAGLDKIVTIEGVSINNVNYKPENTTIYINVDISSIYESKLLISGLPTSITYGDADFLLEATSAGRGKVNWESNSTSSAIIGGDTGNVHIKGAGTVTIRATKESDGNYNETTNSISFTVEKKPTIYTITGNTVSYSGQVQYATITPAEKMTEGLDYEVIYSQDGKSVEEPMAAGIYDITVNTLNDNYSGRSTGATLTIQAADQTYKLEVGGLPSYIEYEDEFALYANGGNGQGDIIWQVTSGTSIAAISDNGLVNVTGVGNATITATKEADGNFNEKSVSISLATNKKEISAAISGTHKEYNGKTQSVSLAGTAVKYNNLSDIIDASYQMQSDGSASEFRDVGKYNVYLAIEDEFKGLYRLSGIKTGFADISRKQLVITADDKTKTYGEGNPDFTMSYDLSGTDEAINEPSIRSNADESSNTGSYGIELSYDGDHGNENYDIVLVNGTLKVEKEDLIVSADDITIQYMDTAPSYTVVYEGFIEGEDSSVLAGQLVMDCSYDKGDDIGDYSIEASGLLSENYNISYEVGTLNVESMPVEIMASAYTDYMTLRLSKAVAGISLENIIISGEVDKESMRDYYHGAKYVVYTELVEGESYQVTIDFGKNYSFDTAEFEAEHKRTSSGGSHSTGTHVPVKEEPEVPEEPEVKEPTEDQHWAKGKSDKLQEAFGIREVFGLIEESEEKTGEESGTEDNSNSSDGMNYERGITRGEIAGVMCRILGIVDSEIQDDNNFDDLDESHKLYKDMLLAVEYGIFEGYGDGTFKPDQVISREEMATVIYRSMIKVIELAEASDDLSYSDKESIKFWAQEQVALLTELGIFEGYEDGEFKPENTIKVGEAITALYRMAEYMEYIN